MAAVKCDQPDCDWKSHPEVERPVQSLAMHKFRKHGISNKDKAELEVAPKRKYTKKKHHLDGFLQEKNVEVATAYVLAAKWPNGVPVEDLPRVVKLVKAVEHG